MAAKYEDSAANIQKGFGELRCPKCGEEATISLSLDNLKVFTCGECQEEFEADDVREMLAQAKKWELVFAWLQQAGSMTNGAV